MTSITKTETEVLNLEVEFARVLEYIWRPGTSYELTNYVRPLVANGFEYECTNAGQTATSEPVWSSTIAATMTDGSVEWTCRDFSTNATDTIASENVTADTGLTIASASTTGTVTEFDVSGGTDGFTYEVSVEVTTAGGKVFEEKIQIVIDGD